MNARQRKALLKKVPWVQYHPLTRQCGGQRYVSGGPGTGCKIPAHWHLTALRKHDRWHKAFTGFYCQKHLWMQVTVSDHEIKRLDDWMRDVGHELLYEEAKRGFDG